MLCWISLLNAFDDFRTGTTNFVSHDDPARFTVSLTYLHT